MNKIKTHVLNVAWKANSQIPKPIADALEQDFHRLIVLYTYCASHGKMEALQAKLNEFCKQEIIEIADIIRDAEKSAPVCEDWKKGFRTTHGACTNCGARH